jgi:hypothetical protein
VERQTIGGFISKWIHVPLALLMVIMIVYGVIGTKVQVIEVKEQVPNKVATGTVKEYNKDEFTLKLDVDTQPPETIDVAVSKTANIIVYNLGKDDAGEEIVVSKKEKKISEVPDVAADGLADGKKITIAGEKNARKGNFLARAIHIGGIRGSKEYKPRMEQEEIYNTAVILCIACVGLGDSDMNRLLQIIIIFFCVMIAYVVMSVIIKSVRRSA